MKSFICSISLLFVLCFNLASGAQDKVVICYYGTWASYRVGLGKFEVTDIPTDLCTHIVYTFLGIDYSGNVKSLDPYLDYPDNWGKGYLQKFNALKKNNPHLKTILAVGGFNEGSEKYSLMAASPKLRSNFITSSINIVNQYGFDGLEVDWEYPNRRDSIYGWEDVNNFSQLLKELREEFDKRGLLLMASVAALEQSAQFSYNISAISRVPDVSVPRNSIDNIYVVWFNYNLSAVSLDLISIMTYDMYGAWDPVTGHNAPLHKGEGDAFSVEVALEYWLKNGCPPEKIILGVPLYGRTFLLTNAQQNSVKAPASGAGIPGPYTQTRGQIGYNELCYMMLVEIWYARQDTLSKVPYAVQGRDWVSYDDANSIAAKVEYGLQHGIAGIMAWSIETDDFHGICHGEDFPLLRSINRALGKFF